VCTANMALPACDRHPVVLLSGQALYSSQASATATSTHNHVAGLCQPCCGFLTSLLFACAIPMCRPWFSLSPSTVLFHSSLVAVAGQAVVLIVQHTQQGTVGLLLNRPTGMVMRPGRGGLRYAIIGAPESMQEVFADNRCVLGRQSVSSVPTHAHCAFVPVAWVAGTSPTVRTAAMLARADVPCWAHHFMCSCQARKLA
jgi:hypothetical protein